MATTYWDYIRVEDLLALQGGIEGDESALSNDEVLFIVQHQIHELWFKLALREMDSVRTLFLKDHVPETSLAAVARGIRRVSLLFKMAADHFAVIETMTTRDFLDFRDKLIPASGFQSAQFRELEILIGLGEDQRIPLGNEGSYLEALKDQGADSPALRRVQQRQAQGPSVRDALERWLYRTPIEGSQPDDPDDEATVLAFLDRFLDAHRREIEGAASRARTQAITEEDVDRLRQRYQTEIDQARAFLRVADPRVRRTRAAVLFIESYRELPLLAWPREILDRLIEFEQSYTIFRQRHARMVERMIGRRVGTGGSDGVAYLDQTALHYRVFPDFWQVRTFLLPRESIPALQNTEGYDFRAGRG